MAEGRSRAIRRAAQFMRERGVGSVEGSAELKKEMIRAALEENVEFLSLFSIRSAYPKGGETVYRVAGDKGMMPISLLLLSSCGRKGWEKVFSWATAMSESKAESFRKEMRKHSLSLRSVEERFDLEARRMATTAALGDSPSSPSFMAYAEAFSDLAFASPHLFGFSHLHGGIGLSRFVDMPETGILREAHKAALRAILDGFMKVCKAAGLAVDENRRLIAVEGFRTALFEERMGE